jgi:hypothetical protein
MSDYEADEMMSIAAARSLRARLPLPRAPAAAAPRFSLPNLRLGAASRKFNRATTTACIIYRASAVRRNA